MFVHTAIKCMCMKSWNFAWYDKYKTIPSDTQIKASLCQEGMLLIQKWMKLSIHNHPKVDDYYVKYESSNLGWLWSSKIICFHFWMLLVISFWMKFVFNIQSSIVEHFLSSLYGWKVQASIVGFFLSSFFEWIFILSCSSNIGCFLSYIILSSGAAIKLNTCVHIKQIRLSII